MKQTRREMLATLAALGAVATGARAQEGPEPMQIPTPEPRIARFEKLAYGMFMHWGLYSQLGRGEWVMNIEKIPVEEYRKLKDTFTAEEFDGRAIAATARRAGMRYVTLTTRHHEGFSLYDTRGLSDYDAPHSPAGRDLVREFVDGCRAEGIVPFFYHTTLDWYQPSFSADFDAYLEYLRKSVEVLCTHYGEIGGLWFDGNWSKPDADWREDELYGMIRRLQPEAMIINNTGLDARGRVGNPEIDSVTFEQGRPTPMDRRGMPKYVAAEMCQTMNRHWGIGARDFAYMAPGPIIEHLCACRKVGANYLLNVGPTAGGRIPAYEKAALERAGDWVRMFADAVYEGKPCGIEGPGHDFGLRSEQGLYLFAHDLAAGGDEHVVVDVQGAGPRTFQGVEGEVKSIRWIDSGEELTFERKVDTGELTVNVTGYPYGTNLVVRGAKVE